MPRLLDNVLHPEDGRPQPAAERVDLRPPILVGMSVWAVALVVALVLAATGTTSGGHLVAITASGLALGVVGLGWERRNRARYRG